MRKTLCHFRIANLEKDGFMKNYKNKKPSSAKIVRPEVTDGFHLPLPLEVEGKDILGNNFKEQTSLTYISHYGSSFFLKTPVTLGETLRLSIDLPPKLTDNQPLKLILKGEVIFIENNREKTEEKRISTRFRSKYIIAPEKDDAPS